MMTEVLVQQSPLKWLWAGGLSFYHSQHYHKGMVPTIIAVKRMTSDTSHAHKKVCF